MKKVRSDGHNHTLRAANGTEIKILGEATLPIVIINHGMTRLTSTVNGRVSDHVSEGLLGIDWLIESNALWNLQDSSVSLGGYKHKLNARPRGHSCCRRIVVQADTEVPPRSQQNLGCTVVFHSIPGNQQSQQWETEPAALQCGLLVARTLTPSDRFEGVPVRVMNLDEEPRKLKAGTVVRNLPSVDVLRPMTTGTATEGCLNESASF